MDIPKVKMLCYNIIISAAPFMGNKNRSIMKVLTSLKSAKTRHPDCQIVRRRGRVYVICKTNPRFKAVQGGKNKS